MPRKKKYAEGGLVVEERDLASAVGPQSSPFSGAGVELEAAARRGEAVREAMRRNASKVADTPKRMSFNEAFAAARRRGDKTFSWNGGSYGTKLKGEDTPAPAKRAAEPAPAKRAAAPTPARAPAPRATEDKMITVTARRPDKPQSVGRAINRAVGVIDDQMKTQARNMAALRAKNPDLVTRVISALSRSEPARATPPRSRAVDDKVGLMLQRPPPLLRMKNGGSVKKPTATKLVRKKK